LVAVVAEEAVVEGVGVAAEEEVAEEAEEGVEEVEEGVDVVVGGEAAEVEGVVVVVEEEEEEDVVVEGVGEAEEDGEAVVAGADGVDTVMPILHGGIGGTIPSITSIPLTPISMTTLAIVSRNIKTLSTVE
jgi:hypothetical protein